MLFNSYIFIFAFLPITLIGFALFQRFGKARLMTGWLVLCSLFFYGWWNPIYLLLLGLSIGVNFAIGRRLSTKPSKTILTSGIAFNISLLGYFKYAGFFGSIIGISITDILLPLAISFFTFQQITYLIDAAKGKTQEYNFLDYCLFVTFFPQLIAGPIVHHKDMMPQFSNRKLFGLTTQNLAIGLTFFIIGLFKKVVIADEIAQYATPVFDTADAGGTVYFVEAWVGALSYTFQLYFDFSGYSDMAIGLARIFGIQLPLNFFSPYKAVSIIDFWRRWHITLSHFLRDYLYIPLGGNRKGNFMRYNNLMITMVLGGLWHGAGWNFLIWGGLHGGYLMINHAWRALCSRFSIAPFRSVFGHMVAVTITFIAVVMAWVFFRATTFDGAASMVSAMIGMNGVSLPREGGSIFANLFVWLNINTIAIGALPIINKPLTLILLTIMPIMLVTFIAPNSAQFMRRILRDPASIDFAKLNKGHVMPLFNKIMPVWKINYAYAFVISIMAVLSFLSLTRISEFLYFQF